MAERSGARRRGTRAALPFPCQPPLARCAPGEPLRRVAAALSLYLRLPRVTQAGRGARCSRAGGTQCPRPRGWEQGSGTPPRAGGEGWAVRGKARGCPPAEDSRVRPPRSLPRPAAPGAAGQNLRPRGSVPALKRSPVRTGAPVGPAPSQGVGRGGGGPFSPYRRRGRAGAARGGSGRPRTLGHGVGRAGAERGGTARLGRYSAGGSRSALPEPRSPRGREVPPGAAERDRNGAGGERRGWVRRAVPGARGARPGRVGTRAGVGMGMGATVGCRAGGAALPVPPWGWGCPGSGAGYEGWGCLMCGGCAATGAGAGTGCGGPRRACCGGGGFAARGWQSVSAPCLWGAGGHGLRLAGVAGRVPSVCRRKLCFVRPAGDRAVRGLCDALGCAACPCVGG